MNSLGTGCMNFLKSFLVFALLVSCGCSRSIGKRDRSELEQESVEKGMKLIQSGRPSDAVKAFERSLESDPKLARVHLELGFLLHDSEKDYVGAVYHYRKYMQLRPKSQKKAMIENRIRIAKQMLAAGVVGVEGVTAVRTEELEKENLKLRANIRQLQENLARTRSISRTEMSSRKASNVVDGAKSGSAFSQDGGISKYTVQKGDSLSGIALKVYGDANRWEEIYEANRRALENSNDLRAGQALIIP